MKKSLYLLLAVVMIISFTLSACGPAKLGTEENPILWVFVPSREGEEVTTAAEGVADMLHEKTGLYFKTFVATDYTAAIEAECSDPPKAHMGSLATFALITAADRGCAEPALVASRRGSTSYTGQIIASADSGITTLADIKGKTFCATEPSSTSGWIIPSVMLRAAGLDLETDITVTYAGGHDAAVLGVYNGDCDAGASFVDARTLIEGDYPDVMEKVNVVEVSIPIPNDGVQFANSFDPEMKQQIVAALLEIAGTEEGKAALNAAYQWDGLEAHGNEFYDPFRQLLDAAGISAADLE
ncbi:MAG: phosphate/phosphite/phosphonate ABC transporter substrate-binding protein [Anaerolineales bacterium]|nr:phosphate/phosphite/phosphonate ABC transporter substrate-binding protein [Anaerolineales bacterium]